MYSSGGPCGRHAWLNAKLRFVPPLDAKESRKIIARPAFLLVEKKTTLPPVRKSIGHETAVRCQQRGPTTMQIIAYTYTRIRPLRLDTAIKQELYSHVQEADSTSLCYTSGNVGAYLGFFPCLV